MSHETDRSASLPHEAQAAQQWLNQLLNDDDLLERHLPPLSAEEKSAFRRLAPALHLEAVRWTLQWPFLMTERAIVPVVATNIICCSHLPLEAILARVKSSLWIFALDDLFDGDGLSPDRVAAMTSDIGLAACKPGGDVVDPLARCLDSIHKELTSYPNYPLVHPFWVYTVARLLDGMAFEYWTRASRRSPATYTAEEYAYFASPSVAVTHVWVTGLMLEPDADLPKVLSSLVQLAELCALPVRLANDLATYERERARSEVQALTIRESQLRSIGSRSSPAKLHGLVRAQTMSQIKHAQDAARIQADRLAPSHIARGFTRAMDFAVALYCSRDFRSWDTDFQQALLRLDGQ